VIILKKKYTLYLRDINNPKLLENLLELFIDYFTELCKIEIIVEEKKIYSNRNTRIGKGLDQWLT